MRIVNQSLFGGGQGQEAKQLSSVQSSQLWGMLHFVVINMEIGGLGRWSEFENHRMTDPKGGRCNQVLSAGNTFDANEKSREMVLLR